MSRVDRRAADGAIACGIFLIGAYIGLRYVQRPEVAANARYYQETFAPAVLVACGRGFHNTSPDAELAAFLDRKADAFDCRRLSDPAPPAKITALQSASRYLRSRGG